MTFIKIHPLVYGNFYKHNRQITNMHMDKTITTSHLHLHMMNIRHKNNNI